MKRVLLLPMVLAAASGGAVSSASAASTHPAVASVVHLTAVASGLKYNEKVVSAKAGKIKLNFTNASSLQHNVRLEQGETEFGGTKTIGHGSTSVLVTLKKGTYHFYCSVPGHEDAGMTGTLNVT